jgi:hypothetical protein
MLGGRGVPIRNIATGRADFGDEAEIVVGQSGFEFVALASVARSLAFDAVKTVFVALFDRGVKVAGVTPERFEDLEFHAYTSLKFRKSIVATRKPMLSAR